MRTVADLMDMAVSYRGSEQEVLAALPDMPPLEKVATLSDDRILAAMTRCVFQAGFSWKVINNKWPGFEEAFEGFVPVRWKFMSDDDLDSLVKDTRIVRHGTKIRSVMENAILLCDLEDEHGSAAACIAHWPATDLIGLLDMLKKRGSRLGGNTGGYFLRTIGKDCWVLSRDVVQALVREGVVDKAPTSKTAMRNVQQAFDTWVDGSDFGYAQVSRLLSFSVGPNV